MWIANENKDLKVGDKVELTKNFSSMAGTMIKGTIATITGKTERGYDITDDEGHTITEIGFEGLKKTEKFKVDNLCLPAEFTKEEKEQLNDVVSENGEYVIPVEWTVYSTVKVTNARNLAEAIAIVHQNGDEIPLDTEPAYVDGSYRVNLDNYEQAILDYDEIGDKVTIDANDYDRDELEDEIER